MSNNFLQDDLQKLIKKSKKCRFTLIAASKTRSTKNIREACEQGITHFGENYVQEAQEKHREGAYKGCTLHLIGHLQSNKAEIAVEIFDVIQTVDSIKLANTLDKACKKYNRSKLEIMIQVNQGEEEQKHGISKEKLRELIQHIQENCPHLKLTGLMSIPPNTRDAETHFQNLKQLTKVYNLPHCSMGMSSDYKTAIEYGATHIRLGTAIFGQRKSP